MFKFRKNTESKNPNFVKSDNRKLIPSSKCVMCYNKKSNKIKPVFKMKKFVQVLKIFMEEQFVTRGYVIKFLLLPKIQNIISINMALLQWFIYFLMYKSAGAIASGGTIKSKIMSSEQLAEGLHKPITTKF